MKKSYLKIFVTLILVWLCLIVLPSEALAADAEVTYLDETGSEKIVTATVVTSTTSSLGTGWYVVNSDVIRSETITVTGTAHLILSDGKTLTVAGASGSYNAGINVTGSNSLTIYGQAGNTGVLHATGSAYGAGIGGNGINSDIACGTITINGGTVNAYGGNVGAGIGSGWYGIGGTIIVNRGIVNATGGTDGAGIGGGSSSGGGTITINSGTVTATGGDGGSGIGSGGTAGGNYTVNGGNITINGGTIKATGGIYGAGIGGGIYASGGNITIREGLVTAASADNPWGGTGIGGGFDRGGGNITISGGTITAKGETCGAGIGGSGSGDGGIITIRGGTIVANGDDSVWGGSPGIGSGTYGNGCTITLEGGVVFAQAGPGAKDVGGGAKSETHGTLDILNTAALFLKSNSCATPTTTTHTNEAIIGHTANAAVYGIPVHWSGNFHAYLRLCTLSYNLNNGSGTVPPNVTQHIGTSVSVSDDSDVSRTGYSASGWNTSADGGGGGYNAGDTFTFAENTTLYAAWTPYTYTISYNANGGSGSTASSSHTYDTSKKISENSFIRTGYTFSGWATSSSGAAVYSGGESVVNLTSEDKATLMLHAVWSANTYTVSYNSNGGFGSTVSSTHTYDTAKTLTINSFTKPGYTFSGWSTHTDGATGYMDGQDVINLTHLDGETFNLYAVWTVNSYTVEYNPNGGLGSAASSNHTYDEVKILTANSFTRIGFTFTGWATNEDGEVIYSDKENVVNLTEVGGEVFVLYAVWVPHTYTVSYHANGGSGTTVSSSHTYGVEKKLTANNFTRAGHSFLGWATNVAGAVVYSGGLSVVNLTSEDDVTITLYAVWTNNAYIVNYNPNGAIGSTASSSHTYGAAKTLTVNGFSRKGYTFMGWADRADGAAIYMDEESIANLTSENGATLMLYAVWEANSYTVKYNANGGTGNTPSSRHSFGIAKALSVNGFIRTGYIFTGWATDADGAAVYSEGQSVVNLTSKNDAVVIMYAVWTPIYTLSVESGTGSGSYEARTQVAIAAEAAPYGKEFDRWTSNGGGTFEDVKNAATKFTMPDQDVVVVATYRDLIVLPKPSATVHINLEPVSLQFDQATGRIAISIDVSSLPEGTTAIQLPSGNIIPIDTAVNILEVQLSPDDMSIDGNLVLIALDEAQVPLGSYSIEVSDDIWQGISSDNEVIFLSILIWIVLGVVGILASSAILFVRYKKNKNAM